MIPGQATGYHPLLYSGTDNWGFSTSHLDGVRFVTLPFTPTSADGTSEMSLVYT
jgi:hypothetical protein